MAQLRITNFQMITPTCGLDFDVLDFLLNWGVASLNGLRVPGQASHVGLIWLAQLHYVALDGRDLLFSRNLDMAKTLDTNISVE